jgi:hypothetical protein
MLLPVVAERAVIETWTTMQKTNKTAVLSANSLKLDNVL